MGDEKVTRRLETLIARPGGCLNLTSNSLDTPVEVMTTSTNGLSGSNANVFLCRVECDSTRGSSASVKRAGRLSVEVGGGTHVAPAMSKCCRYEREPTV